jgi:hypothetical protein
VIYYPHQHRWAIDALNDHAHLNERWHFKPFQPE